MIKPALWVELLSIFPKDVLLSESRSNGEEEAVSNDIPVIDIRRQKDVHTFRNRDLVHKFSGLRSQWLRQR